MKRISFLIIFVTIFAWFASFGCGGGGSDATGDPSISSPEDTPADGDTSSTDGTGTAEDEIPVPPPPLPAPDKVLIVGSLVDAEGTAMPGVTITFHSDPVEVITDINGAFEALLDVGSHTVETVIDGYGTIHGELTAAATGYLDQRGRALGSFVATMYDPVGSSGCLLVNLVDLGKAMMVDTYFGVAASALGDEISVQGLNQTSLIVGNSEMLANISIDGRLSGLWFPTVGAFNHIPYLSKVNDWVKPYQGSFGGIKRGEYYYWLTDRNYWSLPTIRYQPGTFAPIAEMTYDGVGACEGATIKEKVYVVYNAYPDGSDRANVLMRDFTISFDDWRATISNLCRTMENASFTPQLAVYARFNTNDTYQMFKQWAPSINSRFCRDDRMFWVQEDDTASIPIINSLIKKDPDLHEYTIVMSGHSSTGAKLAIQDCTDTIETTEDAWRVVPYSFCAPAGVKGSIVEWTIPTNKNIVIETAGCNNGGTACEAALNSMRLTSPSTYEGDARTRWTSWVGTPAVGSGWLERTKRWLITMKMFADRNTGAIIAAPSQEPTYNASWPRDGTFQALAFMMAGKYDIAEKFFSYLFNMFPGVESDYGWNQAYSSLDATKLGLPDDPPRMNIEEDQPPTVLWGLWVYWTKRSHALPPGITPAMIKNVADYVVAQICPDSGLLRPSIDRLESPLLHMGQSLYTNAAVYAGLAAAAEMINSSDPTKADEYRAAAISIRDAIEDLLCNSAECHTRIRYFFEDFLLDGTNMDAACDKCTNNLLRGRYVDVDLERIMAFAWPFHLFDLDDPRVMDYYNKVWATHDDLGEFSYENSLWVPRYIYTYLFARAAYDASDVDASFKSRLLPDIREVEANIDAVTTDYGYIQELYIGGHEGDEDVYGPEYAGKKMGAAARPLGWAQAMGVLMAYEINGGFVPLIDPPVPPTTCTIGSGPCCDATGNFKLSTEPCSTTTDYGCPDGTACGADVKTRTSTRYCSGSSATCSGSTVNGTWSTTAYDDCLSTEMCVAGNPVCQPCGSSCECSTSSDCCDGCHYRPTTYPCGSESRMTCEWGTSCGADVSQSFRTRYCSGTSSSCNGAYDPWIAPVPLDYCDTTEVCVSGNPTCQTSSSCSPTCECSSSDGPCCDGCHLQPSSYHCQTSVPDHGCPWGTTCGADVGFRTGNRHCTGASALCSGTLGDWTTYTSSSSCTEHQACSTSTYTCESPSRCACDPITTWPANLYATGLIAGVYLQWTAATGASQYIITRSPGRLSDCPVLGLELKRASGITTTDATAPSGVEMTYGIYAVDTCGNVSACGDFATATRL